MSNTVVSRFGWFAPPNLPSADLRRRARALWIVSWPFFALVAAILALAVAVEPHTLGQRATTASAVGALVAVLHTVSRRGRPVLASWMLVIGLTVIVTQRAWIAGGIHAPVAAFYAMFIVMGGALLGNRGGALTALACLVGAIVLTVGEGMSWLAPSPGVGPISGALVFVVLVIGLAFLLQTLINSWPQERKLGADAVQMLVHDLRSPLHVLLAHLDLLQRTTTGESAKHVEGAIGGATALNRMASNLLDVSRLETGRMPVRRAPIDLKTLAHEVVETFRVLQPERRVVVLGSGEATVSCDLEIMRRVIENLVSNAIKHGPAEGAVMVVVSNAAGVVRLAVQDEGPGIPFDQRERIFVPFSADKLRARNGFESSGLGLAFCRLAVEAHGGRIIVEDGSPRGCVFVVELPG